MLGDNVLKQSMRLSARGTQLQVRSQGEMAVCQNAVRNVMAIVGSFASRAPRVKGRRSLTRTKTNIIEKNHMLKSVEQLLYVAFLVSETCQFSQILALFLF
eukprot:GHVT01092879.1.p1 GENE.GHVT01092879.1~~GHVT01092879.1.p1  ORF type:complete len:101 (-),score=6.20 GHVT01092879.1:254-556(-)